LVVRSPSGACDPDAVKVSAAGRRSTAVRLFPQADSRLSRYCVVKPIGAGVLDRQAVEAYEEMAKSAGYESERDYNVVLTAGPLMTLPRPEGRTTYLERAGAPIAPTWPSVSQATRIALVDSAQSTSTPGWSVPTPAVADHGTLLARLIEELVCPNANPTDPACLAVVRPYKALSVNTPQGPQGAVSELAERIVDALNDAKDDGVAHLVINLSVGWVPVPQLGGPDINKLPLPAAAVADALRFAACRGAVTFAAAGNNMGGPNGNFDAGFVYPAGWENEKTKVDCKEFTGDSTSYEGSIVHAVGGVGPDGRRLAVTRVGSMPTLAGYADDGTASSVGGVPGPGQYTAPISGTSVGTAVVSASAAARWALQSGLTNIQLPNALRDPVTSSPEVPDKTFGPYTAVSVVRACEQVNAACPGGGCGGASWSCPAINPPGPSAGTLAALAAGMTVKQISGLVAQACSSGTVTGPTGHITCPDSYVTSIDETPWVHPQPEDDPCFPCVGERQNPAQASILVERTMAWKHSWLVLESIGGTHREYIDLQGIIEKEGLESPTQDPGVVFRDLPVSASLSSGYRAKILAVVQFGAGPEVTVASEVPFR
jgi:hypothetical protein